MDGRTARYPLRGRVSGREPTCHPSDQAAVCELLAAAYPTFLLTLPILSAASITGGAVGGKNDKQGRNGTLVGGPQAQTPTCCSTTRRAERLRSANLATSASMAA